MSEPRFYIDEQIGQVMERIPAKPGEPATVRPFISNLGARVNAHVCQRLNDLVEELTGEQAPH